MSNAETAPIDLTSCDREPIHVIGHIQPHGVLIVLDPSSMKVLQVSESCRTHLDMDPSSILGERFPDFMPASSRETLAKVLLSNQLEDNPTYLLSTMIGGYGPFHVIGHIRKGLLLLDIKTQSEPSPIIGGDRDEFLQHVFDRFGSAKSVAEYGEAVVEKVQELTGFGRVMVYRFEPDGTGVVVAERIEPGYESFLGLRYPASDVPRQARELFVKNQVRSYPDIDYVESPMVPALTPSTGDYLDMSYSALRGVSRLHTEYLSNMGVKSALVLAITQGGQLWGLVNAQHHTSRRISFEVTSACELMARVISLQLTDKNAEELAAKQAQSLEIVQGLLEKVQGGSTLSAIVENDAAQLLTLLEASGVVSWIGERFSSSGSALSETETRELVEWLERHQSEPVWATGALTQEFRGAEFSAGVAGVLSMRLSPASRDFMIWLRPEWVHSVNWAGDPNKPVEVVAGEERLRPRKSFALWRQNVTGRSIPWSEFNLEVASRLHRSLDDLTSQPSGAESSVSADDLADANMLAGRRLGALLDSLIRFSNALPDSSDFEECDLNLIVNEAVTRLGPLLEANGATVDVSENLPHVGTVRAQLVEVFLNLITSGVEYNRRHERRVRVFLLDATSARQYASSPDHQPKIVCVQDNGIGMSPEYAEEIFSIFHKVKAKIDVLSGLGGKQLGLTKKPHANSGRIWVDSVVGEGTTFYLEFAA